MRKAGGITVTVGSFGSDPTEISIDKDTSIREALEEAGISTGSAEKIYVNGERATLRDILEDGDVVNVVSSKEAGSR